MVRRFYGAMSVGAALAGVGAWGCEAATDAPERIDQARQAVHGGSEDLAAHPQVVSVGVPLKGVQVGCTGVFIASNVVLTAGHCAKAVNSPDAPLDLDPEHYIVLPENLTDAQKATLLATVPPSPGVTAGQLRPSEVLVHPSYKTDDDRPYDVMLLKLSNPVPRSVFKPLPVTPGYGTGPWFWVDYVPRLFGVGATDSGCSGPAGGAVRFLDGMSVTGASELIHFANPAPVAHTCAGDSGGPYLTRKSANGGHAGKHLDSDMIISIHSGLEAGGAGDAVGPILERPDIRAWLVTNALDQDGDKLEAPFDKCDLIAGEGPGQVQPDKDYDGLGDACDPCVTDPDNEDTDGDGILNCLDACPDDPQNPDKDGDGVVDCADPCPGEGKLTGDDAHGDADHDGICNSADNCAKAFNLFQDNANRRSEDAHKVPQLGDRCDPVPVPEAVPSGMPADDPGGPVPCVHPECIGFGPEDKLFLQCATFYRHSMRMRPLRSQHKEDPSKHQDVLGVPTVARFCQPKPLQGIKCINKMLDIQDELLDENDCADGCQEHEVFETRFYRVSFALGGNVDPDGLPVPLDYTVEDEGPDPGIFWVWDYKADLQRWIAAGQLVFKVNTQAELKGAFWTHAVTQVGSDLFVPDKGFYHGDELANHHLTNHDGVYIEDETKDEAKYMPEQHACYKCIHLKVPYVDDFGADSPSSPEGQPPPPYFIWRPVAFTSVDAYRRLDAEPKEASLILPIKGEASAAVRTAQGPCNGEVAEGLLGPHLVTRLTDASLRWINAAEPSTSQGAAVGFPLAVALSSGPVDVIDAVVDDDGRALKADGDLASVREPGVSAPFVTKYAAVLSRVRRGVFVIGGEDPETGDPSGRIWFRLLDGRVWKVIATEAYSPEEVLAATFSVVDRRLYVLDERSDGTARLATVDPDGGGVVTVGVWPRHPAWDLHWLVVDRDGAVLLASASTSTQKHAITRIEAATGGGPKVTGRLVGARALVLPPLVDGAGYTQVLRKAKENEEVETERVYTLPFVASQLEELGGQL